MEEWVQCFKNLTKLGLTKNISEIFLELTKYLINSKFYDILSLVLQNLVPFLFNHLYYDKFREGAFEVLEIFLLGSYNNAISNEKIMKKYLETLINLSDKSEIEIVEKLVNLGYCVKSKFDINEKEFLNLIEFTKEKFNLKVFDDKVIKLKILKIDWGPINQKNTENFTISRYKGLANIGNSKFFL